MGVWSLGFRASGIGVQGFGGLGFRVEGLGLRFFFFVVVGGGLGLRVSGTGLRGLNSVATGFFGFGMGQDLCI